MSRRTPIEELRDEESGAETPTRRRSSRIAAVTTRRSSVAEDIPAKITMSKRLSLSQESYLNKGDSKTSSDGPSTPRKKVTRSASKSPSALSKTENVPAMRTRRRASSTSIMEEETQKKERAASPALSKITTRRRSLRSMSTSPTSEAPAASSKPSTPRKSSRAVSASPTNDLTKSAPPKLRGRRPSVTEKIIPLESIEESESKTEEVSATRIEETESNGEEKTVSTVEEISDDNLSFKKKKANPLKKQNLQTIAEKITEENEVNPIDEQENDTGKKEESSDNSNDEKTSSPLKSVVSDVKLKIVEKNTPETKSKHSLIENSPEESMEEKQLKAVLDLAEKKPTTPNSPRRSPRLSVSDHDKLKQPLQTKSDLVNIPADSDESFHIVLHLSQFDESSNKIEQPKTEEQSLSNLAQENGMNTSSSSNTSDKENLHQVKVLENVDKNKLVENLNVEQKNSPQVEKIIATEEFDNQQNRRKSRTSFYEPMEVEEFPSDYEYSILEKKGETPTKKLTEQLKSPTTPKVADKSSKIMETSIEKEKLDESSVEASVMQDLATKTISDLPESGVLKDISPVKAYTLATELAKPSSPKRRSARLLNQSKSPEEEEKSVINSTPKQKSVKKDIGEDLEKSMEVNLNETTISANEEDLDLLEASKEGNKSKIEESGESSNLNKSATQKEDANKSIGNIVDNKNETKNASILENKELPNKQSEEEPNYENISKEGLSKRKSILTLKSKIERASDSNEVDEELVLVLDSTTKETDSEDINEKEQPQMDCSMKRTSKGKDKQWKKSVFDTTDEDPKDSSSSNDNKKDQTKRDSLTKRTSISNKKEDTKVAANSDSEDSEKDNDPKFSENSNTKDNKNNKDPQFSEDSSSSDDEKHQFKKDSLAKRTSISNKKEDPKVAANSDKEDSEKDNDPKFSENSNTKDNKNNEDPQFSEDSSSSDNEKDQFKRDSLAKRTLISNKKEDPKVAADSDSEDSEEDNDPQFSDDSDSEDSEKDGDPKFSDDSDSEEEKKDKLKRDSTMKRVSISNDKEDPRKNKSRRDSTIKRLSVSKKKNEDSEDDEENFSKNSDCGIKTSFVLYSKKSRKSLDSKQTKIPSIVINADNDTEKNNASDLDSKINSLIANQSEDSSSSEESVTHYLDDLAEEGEEDTPSEGSNDIIDRGESVGSTESEIDSDDTYENDSFIDDDEEDQLLSGDEYDLGDEKKKKQTKKRLSRIITVSDSDEENEGNELPATEKIEEKQQHSKEKVANQNGVEEDSDLEKMSTQPYCGLTPPSIISVRDSLSDSEKIGSLDGKEESSSNVLINKEDNLQSLEELKQHEISTDALKIEKRKSSLLLAPKVVETIPTTFTPNNSILEDESANSNKAARKRQSSITIHENIKLQDVTEGTVSDRISRVVDVFCSSVKKEDGKDSCGNISLNISLEFLKSPSQNEENSDISLGEKLVEKNPVEVSPGLSKSKIEKDLQILKNKLKKQELENEQSIQKVVEKVLQKRLSSEALNEPREEIKLSAKKQKLAKKQDLSEKSSDEQEKQNEEIAEDWETASDDQSRKYDDVEQKKKLSKKDRKKKRKQQKKTKEIIANDSMSEDLDLMLKKKYTPNTSDELNNTEKEGVKIIPNIANKKTKKKKPVESDNTSIEAVNPIKKRKRDKNENSKDHLIQTTEETKPILKTKKQKNKAKIEEECSIKKTKEPKTSATESTTDYLSDEVFLQEKKKNKKNKKLPAEEIKPKTVTAEPSQIKKKKKNVKHDEAGPSSSEQEESKFQYFPSRILNTLTEKTAKVSVTTKKPKLLPSLTMGKRSWDVDVIDESILPSKTSSKKIKMDLESFNKKDFKNRMLYDPARINRMDSKDLLKKKNRKF